jgi:hypothetical protein
LIITHAVGVAPSTTLAVSISNSEPLSPREIVIQFSDWDSASGRSGVSACAGVAATAAANASNGQRNDPRLGPHSLPQCLARASTDAALMTRFI